MDTLNATHPVIEQCNHIPQLLSLNGVKEYTSISRSTIYAMGDVNSAQYDSTFPKKVQLTQKRVAWVTSEIAEWINSKMNERSA